MNYRHLNTLSLWERVFCLLSHCAVFCWFHARTKITAQQWQWGQVTSLSLEFSRFIICDRDVEELTKCCTFIIKHGHSAWNNMRCNNEILCAGCTKWDAHGAHVVHQHLSASLVYTLQCHSYTTSNVTNILSSMSLIFSLLCQGYTRSCLRVILISAYEVFSILCKGYPDEEWKNEEMKEWKSSLKADQGTVLWSVPQRCSVSIR